MTERGMIFNGEMVRSILDGQKTQTRRPANPSTANLLDLQGKFPHKKYNISCPFGEVGDRIWVRETWGVVSHELDEDGRIQPWNPDRPATAIHEMPFGSGYYTGHAIYAADGDFTWGDDDDYEDGRSCWKPSIHMPRAACRILLEVTGVRVERLNSISEVDAEAEGVTDTGYGDLLVDGYRYLWISIYGEESWQANPWVWVIEFKRIEGDGHATD